MSVDNKRYQIGNHVKHWKGEIVSIEEIKKETVTIKFKDGTLQEVVWGDIKPLPITVDLLRQMGFETVNTFKNPYHTKFSLSITIYGKFYNAHGIVYDDKNIWTFSNTTVLYINQIQNILSVIDPAKDYQIQDNQ
jgi:hypothetical protein